MGGEGEMESKEIWAGVIKFVISAESTSLSWRAGSWGWGQQIDEYQDQNVHNRV